MPEDSKRVFTGYWIPAEIVEKNWQPGKKLLWAEVMALDHRDFGCYASNARLAGDIQVSERTVKTYLAELVKERIIYRFSKNIGGKTYRCLTFRRNWKPGWMKISKPRDSTGGELFEKASGTTEPSAAAADGVALKAPGNICKSAGQYLPPSKTVRDKKEDKTGESPERDAPSSAHKAILAEYHSLHLETTGAKPRIGGHQGKAVKRLLEDDKKSAKEVITKLRNYYAMDEWWSSGGRDLLTFVRHYDKIPMDAKRDIWKSGWSEESRNSFEDTFNTVVQKSKEQLSG